MARSSPATLGIAHVRYPTAGAEVDRPGRPAVPHRLRRQRAWLLAHNGNVINVLGDQAAQLAEAGRHAHLLSSCDLQSRS